MRVDLTVKYEAGHSYDESWEKTDLHCCLCGKKNVWVELGLGDFYNGLSYLCGDCGASYCHPTEAMREGDIDFQDRQRMNAFQLTPAPSHDAGKEE